MGKKSNPYLKTANTEETYTHDDIMELKRCYEDPVYFIKNYVKIVHPTEGTVLFELFDYQEDMIRAFHEERYTIVLSARQTGKCITHDSKVNIVAANDILWHKRVILWALDRKTYDRLYKEV